MPLGVNAAKRPLGPELQVGPIRLGISYGFFFEWWSQVWSNSLHLEGSHPKSS